MLDIIEKVLPYYHHVLRRNREAYILHPIRVAKCVQQFSSNQELVILALLHDALEIKDDLNLSTISNSFSLSSQGLDVLALLTRNYGETSEHHFQRVLSSNSISALIIKYFDCLDNYHFETEDYFFTENDLGLNLEHERAKYKDRANLCKIKLESLSVSCS